MVTSWDCFDTLVTRRRFDPLSVFADMEQRLGLPQFLARRRAAEARAPWTLDSIYNELARDYGWSPAEREQYRQAEIDAELEHCCPIVGNLQQVQDGDLIVSDMYLPADVIGAILRNCGLTADVQIHVSMGGKSGGSIWATLPPIERHVGDNLHSDVASPQWAGIAATHYDGSSPTRHEQSVGGDLALLMRLVRLASPYEPGSMLDAMWREQASLNIPALVLAALELPPSGLAFSMRDSVHLMPIHAAIHGPGDNVEFHWSRISLAAGGVEYRDYVAQTVGGRTIVDLQGTGNSLLHYWNDNFAERPNLIYVTGTLRHGRLLAPTRHRYIELFNSSPLGSLVEYPNRLPCEFSPEVLRAQADAVAIAIRHLPHFHINPDLALLKRLVDLMPESNTARDNIHIDDHTEVR